MTTDQPIPNTQRDRNEHLREFCSDLSLDTGHSPDEEATFAMVNEALTHASAVRSLNHERPEFLGDVVLRLAAREFIQQHHPQLPL